MVSLVSPYLEASSCFFFYRRARTAGKRINGGLMLIDW